MPIFSFVSRFIIDCIFLGAAVLGASLHTASFCEFLSSFELILNMVFSFVKLLIFQQKVYMVIKSRLIFLTFWVNRTEIYQNLHCGGTWSVLANNNGNFKCRFGKILDSVQYTPLFVKIKVLIFKSHGELSHFYIYQLLSEDAYFSKITEIFGIAGRHKGQLISKANFKVFIWTKKPTKINLYFCPSFKKPLRSGWNKRECTKRLI